MNKSLPIRGELLTVKDDLISLFCEHVISAPDHAAVITTNMTLTYQELYIEVIRWKSVLSQHVDDRAIICLERTPRLIAVLLALQWLNVVYIPVDPTTPIERIQTIVEDSRAQVFLYDGTAAQDYSLLPCVQLNLENFKRPDFSVCSTLAPTSSQNSLAYIIYTSGSTGKPKGVAVSRRALNNFLTSMSQFFLHKQQELVIATTTIAFDIAILELFLPIWKKSTLFLANQQQHRDPLQLIALLQDYPITLFQCTPSLWNMLYAAGWTGKLGLVALSGGEPLTSTLAERLLGDVAELWNMYGPTEATVWCAIKQIHPHEPITVGRPIHNMEMVVMDEAYRPLPPHVKGELFVGGLGLAEGYVNNEKLNQERFISYKTALNGRLFRVGDIACTTEEGEFVIFGRNDNQIKLHGYRIELEEIEARIKSFPGINNCAVAVRKEQLVGYLCLSSSDIFSEATLVNYLKNYLLEYMLPKRFVYLEKLPLSISGKIDRKALPAPSYSLNGNASQVMDISPIELTLIPIWEEELHCTNIKIHDNFFELGGHSLLAARIIARIAQQLGKHITLGDFYQSPTIAQFAKVIESARNSELADYKKTSSNMGWFPLMDFQLMFWISRIFEPRLKIFNVVARRRIQGPLNKLALDLALQLAVQKHEVLSYRIHRFYAAQKQQPPFNISWIERSLENLSLEQSEKIIVESYDELFYRQTWRSNKVMLAARLFYLKNDIVEMQLSMPHLIADEHSLTIFFQELINDYQAKTKTSTLSYQSYVLQQNELMTRHIEEDKTFWLNYLQDAGFFPFPEKYVVKDMGKETIAFATNIEMSELLIKKLQQFSIHHQVTLNNVFIAAVGLALQNSCKENATLSHKLYINTLKSTRDNPLYDNVVGCFLRMNAIKLDLEHATSLIGLSKQAQQSSLETMEHQRAPCMIKMAAIGQQPSTMNAVIRFLLTSSMALFSLISKRFNIHPAIVKACATVATFDRKNNFMVSVNVLNNFLSPSTERDKPSLSTSHHYQVIPMKSVFDVWFYKDELQQAQILIASNLTKSFREQFARELLNIFEQSVPHKHTVNDEAIV